MREVLKAVLLFVLMCPMDAMAVKFVDVTEVSGLYHQGPTWGASWRDINADGLNDLTVSLHGNALWARPIHFSPATNVNLYINRGEGRFENQTWHLLGSLHPGDWHGSAWADYDADGDEDVLFLRGGKSGTAKSRNLSEFDQGRLSNQLFQQQEDRKFVEKAESLGLALPWQRGRRASWFDIDSDGRLDAVLAQASPDGPGSTIYLNRETEFFSCSDALPKLTPNNSFSAALLFRGFADDRQYLLLGGSTPLLYRRPRVAQGCVFEPLSIVEKGTPRGGYTDFLLADLDGDLGLDLYGATQCVLPQFAYSKRSMVLNLPGTHAATFKFRAGKGTLIVRPKVGKNRWFNTRQGHLVFLGGGASGDKGESIKFTKSASVFHAMRQPGDHQHGVFFYYNPQTDLWTLSVLKERRQGVRVEMVGLEGFEVVQPPSLRAECGSSSSNLFYVQGNRSWRRPWVDVGVANGPLSTSAATWGDFDNDADNDLVLAVSLQQGLMRLLLLENEDGIFASKETFPAIEVNELAFDSVSTGDADDDGFLDILATLGKGKIHSPGSSVRLYRNQGNDNAWLRIRLRRSNGGLDAPGARVFLTAAGRTQLRYATGGIRPSAQDESVLHFGLGSEDRVDRVLIEWPNGGLEVFPPLEARQVVELQEGSGKAVSTPQLIVSKEKQRSDSPVRVLLLVPDRKHPLDVEWTIDGVPLKTSDMTLVHRFSRGAHKVRARVKSAGQVFDTVPLVLQVD